MRHQRLRLELRLDGELKARYQGRYVEIAECGARVVAAEPKASKPVRKDHNAGGRSGGCKASSTAPVRHCGSASEIEVKNHIGRRAFFMPKASALRFHQSNGSRLEQSPPGDPEILTGSASLEGISPIASEPTPSPRLWATPPGATPAKLCEHYHRAQSRPSKPELSTLVGNRNFLLWPDTSCMQESPAG